MFSVQYPGAGRRHGGKIPQGNGGSGSRTGALVAKIPYYVAAGSDRQDKPLSVKQFILGSAGFCFLNFGGRKRRGKNGHRLLL